MGLVRLDCLPFGGYMYIVHTCVIYGWQTYNLEGNIMFRFSKCLQIMRDLIDEYLYPLVLSSKLSKVNG